MRRHSCSGLSLCAVVLGAVGMRKVMLVTLLLGVSRRLLLLLLSAALVFKVLAPRSRLLVEKVQAVVMTLAALSEPL